MGEALWWFIIAAVFFIAEFGHRAFYALFVAIGALVAAALALAGAGVVVQLPAFVAAAVAGVWLVRPVVMRAMGGSHAMTSGIRGHVGKEVVLEEPAGDSAHPGRVKIDGELWKAVSSDGKVIPAGTTVMLLELEGTTFVVEDVHSLGLGSFELPEET